MKVYIIRHGETEYNAARKAQGWCDVKLTEKGREQAKALGEHIKDIKFDRIISSDLVRTKQTVRLVFGDDAEIEFDARLREINNTVVSGRSVFELLETYGEKYEYARRNFDYTELGGESRESLIARTGDFLNYLKEDKKSEKIAVVTHGGTINAILSNVFDCKLKTTMIHAKNCSVTVLELKESGWFLDVYNYVYSKLT